MMKTESKKSESIHSGQFMVSHFEQEPDLDEYIDESDETTEPVQSTSSTSTNVCMQLERYKAPDKTLSQVYEIDSDLSQVFNTLNVTYKQKLTSPKWNPFKGIRLRSKEKIRLNNVIWRCWHMQFIMKKRPSVCQFASPLDVDIHNTPQAIILEGKYWKRKWKVITAEYKKWRRFNVNRALGTSNILDTKSEIDSLEWPNNDNLMILSDNMSSDTLFSTISQFPFPDSREIARAGRADFIQPSLGPLQPNLEDFMDFDLDIFNNFTNNRLAPVPEEQTEELLKAIEVSMNSMDTSSMQDMMTNTSSPAQGHQSVIQGSPLMNVDQHGPSAQTQHLYTATIYTQDLSMSQNMNHQQISNEPQQMMMSDLNPFLSGALGMGQSQQNSQTLEQQQQMMSESDVESKDPKGKYSRGVLKAQLPKREPHNYDKCQPTAHQTIIYNQMLAQQQEAQLYANNAYTGGSMSGEMTNINHMSPIQTTTNNFNISPNQTMSSQNVLNLSSNQISTFAANKIMMQQQINQIDQQPLSHESYKSPQSPSYRSYHHSNQQPYKIPSQNSGVYQNATSRIMMRQHSPPHHTATASASGTPMGKSVSFQPQHQHSATAAAIKEMYRSNSLPINANIQMPQKEISESFAVPKYHHASKNKNNRSRSNSINLRAGQLMMTPLQSATSEPALNANSALAQLLTNSSIASNLLANSKAHSVSSSAMVCQPPQQPQRANSFTSSSLVQKSVVLAASSAAGKMQSQSQQPSSTTISTPSVSGVYTPTLSPDSAFQECHDLSSLSPERCASLSKFPPRESQRRAGHIHAEQKRRYNIKNGFDMLHNLIPQLQQNPNAKLSKASMLQKGAEYIKQLRLERAAINEQMDSLRKEIDQLNNSLNHLQNALPANGAPVTRQRTGRIREMYQDFVVQRTVANWKFWIFGLIFEPLLSSFNATVSTASMDELCRTTMLWIDNSCTLMEIRPAVSNKLRELSTTTDILSDNPTSLQEEAIRAISSIKGRSHDNPR